MRHSFWNVVGHVKLSAEYVILNMRVALAQSIAALSARQDHLAFRMATSVLIVKATVTSESNTCKDMPHKQCIAEERAFHAGMSVGYACMAVLPPLLAYVVKSRCGYEELSNPFSAHASPSSLPLRLFISSSLSASMADA